MLVSTSWYLANNSLTSFLCSSVSLSEILTSRFVSISFLQGNVHSSSEYTHDFRRRLPLLMEYSNRLITSNEILQFFARHRASKYWHDMYGCYSSRLHGSQHVLILLYSRMVPAIVTITYCYRLGVVVVVAQFPAKDISTASAEWIQCLKPQF